MDPKKNILSLTKNNMIMLSQSQIKKILKEKDIKVLKSLGQNFLVDEKVLDKIVQAAGLDKNDLVIEIGPGLGVLTKELSGKCKQVIAIEKDKKLAGLLEEELAQNIQYSNIEIINDDILKINLKELIKKYSSDKNRTSLFSSPRRSLSAEDCNEKTHDSLQSSAERLQRGKSKKVLKKYKLVSNIPYYITSPVIKFFLENEIQPQTITLLVQKEVAERICARPGKLSVLALSVQIYGKPKIIEYVDRSSFYPKPKVDSAILKISEIKKEFPDNYYQEIFRIIKIGFSSKRKKLVNNLSAGLCIDKDKTEKILLEAKINLNARAQELELKDWKRLTGKILN